MRNYILNILMLLFLAFLTSCLTAGTTGNSAKDKTYRYTANIKFKKVKPGEDMQYIYYPIPPSNDYQTVSNFDTHGGEIFNNPNSIERYVRYTISADQHPEQGNWGEVIIEFDYIPTKSEYKYSDIDLIYEYDTTTDFYNRYTQKYYEIIDTENTTVNKISDSLWNVSTDVYDYAKKCYFYVINNYTFQDNPGFWNTTAEIVYYDGGACGNLSSFYITLLRCKKIPARHVVTRGHVWAEFYLENYSWIPADPTYQTFGKAVKGYGLIRSNEIFYICKIVDNRVFKTGYLVKNHIFYPSHMPFECDVKITKSRIKNKLK